MEEPIKAIEFMYNSQGYVDVKLINQMTGVPEIVIINVLEQTGYKESGIKGQYIKKL